MAFTEIIASLELNEIEYAVRSTDAVVAQVIGALRLSSTAYICDGICRLVLYGSAAVMLLMTPAATVQVPSVITLSAPTAPCMVVVCALVASAMRMVLAATVVVPAPFAVTVSAPALVFAMSSTL